MANLHEPLKSVLNFRDVGEYVNEAAGTRFANTWAQMGALLIGEDEASSEDRQRLIEEYGVRSIIDLRTKTEHIEQAQKRDVRIKASAALPKTNDAVTEPLKIPGITYHAINFNGSAFSRMLLSQLSWLEFFKLVGLMIMGYRKDAIKTLAPHMEAMGKVDCRDCEEPVLEIICTVTSCIITDRVYIFSLVGLAKNSVDVCTREVRQVFDVLSVEENWPVLVHCTQGKDRTGLIVMLILFLLGVDDKIIDNDYRLSESELAPEKEERLKEIGSIGLSERFAECPPNIVSSVQSHIEETYSSVEGYLKSVGVSADQVSFIKGKLLAGSL
ncbi:hypothetical protein NX059_007462 [Plenodomus lindquistii]|nr:hypothetical protein NX059_007462 [Plenodomus lindquistii]